jgi:hypothetical protein
VAGKQQIAPPRTVSIEGGGDMAQRQGCVGKVGDGELDIGKGVEVAYRGHRVSDQKIGVRGTCILMTKVDGVQDVIGVSGGLPEFRITLGELGISLGEQ